MPTKGAAASPARARTARAAAPPCSFWRSVRPFLGSLVTLVVTIADKLTLTFLPFDASSCRLHADKKRGLKHGFQARKH